MRLVLIGNWFCWVTGLKLGRQKVGDGPSIAVLDRTACESQDRTGSDRKLVRIKVIGTRIEPLVNPQEVELVLIENRSESKLSVLG